MAQKLVNKKQVLGVAGEFYDASIKRTTVLTAEGVVKIGSPVFYGTTDKKVAATGTNVAGIAVYPKEHSMNGIGATMEIADGTSVAIADVGRVIVTAKNNVSVGDKVFVCKTAGTSSTGTNYAIGDVCGGSSAPASSASAGGEFAEVTGAKFVIVDAKANEPAVVQL